MKHTDIRLAVIAALSGGIACDVTFFDGRPAVIEEDDFPAVAVYLTDAGYTGGNTGCRRLAGAASY
ncbi:tail protein [Salmonella enterica]|uniref:Tail protein n=1 Tax=Salmonella enterica TaxID=28901 RepID=A0A379R4I0_SALER|nr:tail protein [Salmonella enterica]